MELASHCIEDPRDEWRAVMEDHGPRRVAVVLAITLLSCAARAGAGPGDLDPTFGTGGLVVGALSSAADVATAIVVQPDGKIVVGGHGFAGSELVLARYTASGSLDPTFGTNGVVRSGFGGETVIALVLQPSGKIVAAVEAGFDVQLVRYDVNGALDPTFGILGNTRAYTTLAVGTDGQGGMVLKGLGYDPNGLVIGGAYEGDGRFGLEHVFEDGMIDSGFGAFFGVCEASIGTDGDAELWDVAPLANGGFVAVGSASSGGHTDFALARFDVNGCPDHTFGTNGGIVTPILAGTADERARSVVVEPDGKIVVLGDTGGSPSSFAVVRYLPDGSLDPSFGSAGIALVSVGTVDVARALASSTDGGFVIGGEADGLFTLLRLDPTGHLDPTFGTNGVVQIVQAPFTACCSELRALALQADGKVVAAGDTVVESSTSGTDIGLARLFGGVCGNGQLDPGEQCDDGNVADGDCCSSHCDRAPADSACADDGLRCTRDVCDAAGTCTHAAAPQPACRTSTVAGGARLAIKNDVDPARDRLSWTWRKGAAVDLAELGDPLATTSYTLCGFSATPALLFELDVPPGGICGHRPCWKANDTGVRYRDASGRAAGTTRVMATSGKDGKARALVRAKGGALSLPALPLQVPVRAQLRTDTGLCIESVFSTTMRSDERQFRARSDP